MKMNYPIYTMFVPPIMEDEFWPWFAGLVDGEGCFYVLAYVRPTGNIQLVPGIKIALSSRHEDVLKEIRNKIGFGTIRKDRDRYTVLYFRRQGEIHYVATNLLPYLKVKREACKKLLRILSIMSKHLLEKRLFRKEELLEILKLRDELSDRPHPKGYKDWKWFEQFL